MVIIEETNNLTSYWISWLSHSSTEKYDRLVNNYWGQMFMARVSECWGMESHIEILNKKIITYKILNITILLY